MRHLLMWYVILAKIFKLEILTILTNYTFIKYMWSKRIKRGYIYITINKILFLMLKYRDKFIIIFPL